MQVRWNSSPLPQQMQGGVLSPILIAVYLDDLVTGLKDLGVGCHWDVCFVDAVGYADDVALHACSSSLCIMLRFCEKFASMHGLTFYASKTQLIHFGTQQSHTCSVLIYFSDNQLSFLDAVLHLGHHLSFDLSDTRHIEQNT